MPPIVATIISVIQAIIKAAPDIAKAYEQISTFIKGLFGAGVITKAQQDYIMANVDGFLDGFKPGSVPTHWQVEPDPEPPTPATPTTP